MEAEDLPVRFEMSVNGGLLLLMDSTTEGIYVSAILVIKHMSIVSSYNILDYKWKSTSLTLNDLSFEQMT